MEHGGAGPSSSTPCIAHLCLLVFLVGRSSPGRAELPPPEPQKPQNIQTQPEATFQNKVSMMMTLDSEAIKCFTQRLEDLTCFWEEVVHEGESPVYTFYYQLEDDEDEKKKTCALSAQRMAGMVTRYICSFPMDDVLSFTTLDLWIVAGNDNHTLHHRSLMVDQVVLLDPPSNVTVKHTKNLMKQLAIKWCPPNVRYMHESIKYEVNISSTDPDIRKVEVIVGKSEYVLTNVKRHTTYTIAVRAKPDEVTYDGYWSAWSEPVTVVTSNDLDPLVLTLALAFILALIVLILSAIIFVTHRRFLKRKIWPAIPDPSKHFEGLFSTHKGNFQEWLGHSNSYLWWSPRLFGAEDLVASLEVLSELSPAPSGFPPQLGHGRGTEEIPIFVPHLHSSSGAQGVGSPMQSQLPPASMDSYVVLGENLMPCSVALNNTAARSNIAEASLGRQESTSTISTESSTNDKEAGEEGGQNSRPSSSCTIASPEASQEEQTSSSSFEYTIFDPAKQALSPRPRVPPIDLKYPYPLVSDSGISTDYSSMDCTLDFYSNLYENDVRLGAFSHNQVIYSQC